MEHIRVRMSIRLNQNHALNERELKALKPAIEKAVAGALPESIFVDTITVTRINEATASPDRDKR